jgi:hypothetical protein
MIGDCWKTGVVSVIFLSGWNKSLEDHCAFLHGYKVSWRKDADPYKVKILQSSIRSRKNSAGVRSQESGVRIIFKSGIIAVRFS